MFTVIIILRQNQEIFGVYHFIARGYFEAEDKARIEFTKQRMNGIRDIDVYYKVVEISQTLLNDWAVKNI